MTKAFFLIVTIVLTTASKLTAQDPKSESQRLLNLFQKLEGTYQVQVINSRQLFALQPNMLDSIQMKRKANETIYIKLTDNVSIMVPPYSIINKQGFIPLTKVVYLTSDNK